MKKFLCYLFLFFCFFLSYSSVFADTITPSNSRLQIRVINSDNSSTWSISSGVNSAFNGIDLNSTNSFVVPQAIYYVANIDIVPNLIYTSKFLIRFHYDYDITNNIYYSLSNNLNKYNLNVYNDNGYISDSSCVITNTNTIKVSNSNYDVDYDVMCTYKSNSTISSAWLSFGWNSTLNYSNFIGSIPFGSGASTRLLWYEFTSSTDTGQVIINQNQTIINQNNDINNSINDINDSLNDSNISDSQTQGSSFFNNFSSSDFGLSDIITLPLSTIQSITSSSCSPLTLNIPFINQSLTLPCMYTIYSTYFGNFLTIYQTITFGFISYWVCVKIYALVKDFKNPDHDEIEVLDL